MTEISWPGAVAAGPPDAGRHVLAAMVRCGRYRAVAAAALARWHATEDQLAELRVSMAIQQDKTAGYWEKRMPLHVRFHAVGLAQLVCILLVTFWDGYAVDGGKNLTRVLAHPRCPPEVQRLLRTLLTSPDTEEMVASSLALCDECLALTGGPVERHHGGIPR